MWWNKVIFGWSAYHVVLWFLIYSILGWFVESVYMSLCNKKVTNRGFARVPVCPIYGVGALTVFFILRPYSANPIKLFFMGMLLATAIEFITASIMNRFFGEIWWDYRNKPFNYKGIVCLESSIAWGFYTLALFAFLQNMVVGIVDEIPVMIGKIGGSIVLIVYVVDFFIMLYREKKEDMPGRVIQVKERLLDMLSRD